jgi:hypothetical protein
MNPHFDIPTIAAITGVLTAILVIFQKASEGGINALALRAHWFFRGRLSDLTMARQFIRQDAAIQSMIDRRVFAFKFGFYSKRKLRDRIYKAIEDDELTESQIKACGYKLQVETDGVLIVGHRKNERFELYSSFLGLALCVIGAFGFLVILLDPRNRHIGFLSISFLAAIILAMIGGMVFQMKNVIRLLITMATRKELAQRSAYVRN